MGRLERDLTFQYGRGTVEQLSLAVDLDRFRIVLKRYMEKYPLSGDQVCLTVRNEDDLDVYEGTGSLVNRETGRILKSESEFQTLHPELRGTVVDEAFSALQALTGFQLGRTRIMRLRPKRCYSYHFDFNPRIHLALETNGHSFVIIPPDVFFHVPTDGHFYYFDTRHRHTAINGGPTDRLHFVATLLPVPYMI